MVFKYMVADTESELHAFARKIGLKRSWFQPQSSPHYDLTPAKRQEAVAMGATEWTLKQMGEWLLERRQRLARKARTCGTSYRSVRARSLNADRDVGKAKS